MIARLRGPEAATFDSLLTMLAADGQVRNLLVPRFGGIHVDVDGSGGGYVEPGDSFAGLPAGRLATYARLLRRLEIHYTVTSEPGRVELLQEVWKIGRRRDGIRRGYLWTLEPLSRGVTDEDLMSEPLWTDEMILRTATHYRPVRDGWYLFTTSGYMD